MLKKKITPTNRRYYNYNQYLEYTKEDEDK